MSIIDSNVVELRQYTLHPGKRETLIELFDREFVETQEAEGMEVIGQFRDLDNPDRFVWLRGFRDMDSRRESLAAFYGGPVWKAHRDAANATMIDSDNVLLLRPAHAESGFSLGDVMRAPPGSTSTPVGILVIVIMYLKDPMNGNFTEMFEREIMPALTRVGAPLLATLVTEPAENNFPALPVRTGEEVLVWLSSGMALDAIRGLPASITSRFLRPPEVLRLAPTARSRLRV